MMATTLYTEDCPMRTRFVIAGFFAIMIATSGCGSSADSLINDMIRCMNEMADPMEKSAPKEKLDQIKSRMEDIDKKMKALNLSEDEKKKLMEKHKDALEKAGKRMAEAMMKNVGNMMPGFPSLRKSGNSP
jgi:peptidoglycan hydrolase CwlO-like protein